QVSQLALLVRAQRCELRRRLLHPRDDAVPEYLALVGEAEQLDPAVVRRRAPLDEAARLEAVDDARDVRGVAPERVGQLAHRQRLLEETQRVRLHGREGELADAFDEAASVRP